MVWNESRNEIFKTSSRRLPGDVIKTSLRRLNTSSRLFLEKVKDHLETIYQLCICKCFKLYTYYHSITRQTNCINSGKCNMLNHGKNAEFMKTYFLMKFQTRKYFFWQKLKYFFSIWVSNTAGLLRLLLLMLEKHF